MAYTQENRLITIDTPLGGDMLLLTGFRGKEGLSSLFSFELDMLSENHSIMFQDIIGKNVTVSTVLADGSKRYFNGIISRFSQGSGGGEAGGDPRFSCYTAAMIPWLWLLTRTADSRIFQKLSVPDIVEKIFGEKGFSDYKVLLDGTYKPRDYCVQYRETDFNFISRLLEEEGIFYFFEHEQGKHSLVLADAPDKHKPCPKQETARYQISAGGWLEEDVITGLEWMQEIQAGKYTLKDFNFEIPGTDLKVEVPSQQTLGPGEREIYDYPGEYGKRAEGERLANIRMQEQEAGITTITGSSVCRAFTSGYRFDLQDYYRDDMNNKPYVLTSLDHGATEPVGVSGLESEASYTNSFTCIPFDVPYRPSRLTPKPMVQGTQTAIVVGPSGEEIYTDEHGRVKVQFHWDREGKKDENSSCWIRVSQVWAGAGWGAMHIPRIGQEVIVDFLEGDPDSPIITGRVYHGTNTPPYSLPDEKTKSTIKSDSSLGGGGSNEMRFEDKKGEEEIFIHAEKDLNTIVKANEYREIGAKQHIAVTGDHKTEHKSNSEKDVTGHQITKISAGAEREVTGTEKITITGNLDKTVTAGAREIISGGESKTINGDWNITVNGNKNETINSGSFWSYIGAKTTKQLAITNDLFVGAKIAHNLAVTAENYIGAKISAVAAYRKEETGGLDFRKAKTHKIEADVMITLKCGGSSIEMTPGKITIESSQIDIKGGLVQLKGNIQNKDGLKSNKDSFFDKAIYAKNFESL